MLNRYLYKNIGDLMVTHLIVECKGVVKKKANLSYIKETFCWLMANTIEVVG